MIRYKKIKVEKKFLETVVFPLGKKNLIVIKGKKGYIMCGYLDLKVAQKFGEVAVKIAGVSNIKDALRTKVDSLTSQAGELGIYKGQPIKEVIKIIA